MDSDDLPSFGPIDTSLLAMAAESDSLLLTDERELRGPLRPGANQDVGSLRNPRGVAEARPMTSGQQHSHY